jgi:dipeptidyl aminopeptidase/acylaminoacyl peptidase
MASRSPSSPSSTAEAAEPTSATAGELLPLSAEAMLDLQWIADPRISPDGRRAAYVRVWVDRDADAYRTRIAIADMDGAGHRDLTSGVRDGQPRWSPDGRFLAFARAEGEDPPQIWVLPMAGGEAQRLTDLKGGASDPTWSPDGRRIAFRSGFNPALDREAKPKPKNEPCRVVTRPVFRWDNDTFTDFDHRKHVWVIDAAGGTPRALTTGAFEEGPPSWSRNGERVLFTSDRRPEPWFGGEHTDLYAVSPDREAPTDGEGLEALTDFTGLVGAFAEGPDGRFVAIGFVQPTPARSHDRHDLLALDGPMPVRRPRDLTDAFDADIGESLSSDQHPPRGGGDTPLGFGPDGKHVITVLGRHGAARLARVKLEDGAVELLSDGDHEVLHGTSTPDGRRWAITYGSATQPLVLAAFDAERGTITPLVDPNREWCAGRRRSEVEEFWVDSFDGRRIQSWLVKPPGFDASRRYPLILEIHGGPHAAYGQSYTHEFHMLASAGYLVLFTNPRGSTTYGQRFTNIIQYHYPGDDYLDLMATVDAVIARGCVDEKRLGVTGGSGGGLLTNWVIAKTRRFAAAVTQRCVSDWIAMWYSCDFTLFNESWFKKPPYEDPSEYLERSPATLIKDIETPLMVVHSENDWRTPIGQGETMFRALKNLRRATVMVRFPGEGHELSRSGAPSRRVQRLEHIQKWFDHHLLGKPAPEYGA